LSIYICLFPVGTYYSQDWIKEGNDHPLNLHGDILQDYLAMLYKPGIPPHKLDIKVGAVCTIQRNLSTEKGLVKDARVIIQELNRYSIKVGKFCVEVPIEKALVTRGVPMQDIARMDKRDCGRDLFFPAQLK
jgi:hypothetical protein